jgi:hypothetical protein
MPRKKKPDPESKKVQFGESRERQSEDFKAIESKAANPYFQPGSIHDKRAIDALDYDRWERQRLERKSKNHTLDPYR